MLVIVRLDERFTSFVSDLFAAHSSCELSYLFIVEACDESIAKLKSICGFVQGLGDENFERCVTSVGE